MHTNVRECATSASCFFRAYVRSGKKQRAAMEDGFFTPRNLKVCKSIFKRFMSDRYNVKVDLPEPELRMFFLEIMKTVNADHGNRGMPVKKMNDLSIIIARDIYMRKYAESSEQDEDGSSPVIDPTEAHKPNVRAL